MYNFLNPRNFNSLHRVRHLSNINAHLFQLNPNLLSKSHFIIYDDNAVVVLVVDVGLRL